MDEKLTIGELRKKVRDFKVKGGVIFIGTTCPGTMMYFKVTKASIFEALDQMSDRDESPLRIEQVNGDLFIDGLFR